MSGVFVAVVGPSGAGKDTLIDGARQTLAGDAHFTFPRRVVTRTATSAEDHDAVSPERFLEIEAAGGFAVSWRAHGLSYGIPVSTADDVAAGRVVIANLSRGAIAAVREKLGDVRVVLVTAPAEELRRRLGARGRAADGDLDKRLSRDAGAAFLADLTIDNVGPVEDAIAGLVDFLRPLAVPQAVRANAQGNRRLM